jgi:hypothetical protein
MPGRLNMIAQFGIVKLPLRLVVEKVEDFQIVRYPQGTDCVPNTDESYGYGIAIAEKGPVICPLEDPGPILGPHFRELVIGHDPITLVVGSIDPPPGLPRRQTGEIQQPATEESPQAAGREGTATET